MKSLDPHEGIGPSGARLNPPPTPGKTRAQWLRSDRRLWGPQRLPSESMAVGATNPSVGEVDVTEAAGW